MSSLQKNIAAILFLFSVMLLCASPGFTEDDYRQFSLGGDRLTMTPPDAKAPEPGIVTAKYGFKVKKDFIPYLGTGLAYSYQPDSKTGDIVKIRTGVAAQVGFSYLLGTSSTLKLDYKYLSFSPDEAQGEPRTTPQSIGIGLDIKF